MGMHRLPFILNTSVFNIIMSYVAENSYSSYIIWRNYDILLIHLNLCKKCRLSPIYIILDLCALLLTNKKK